MKKYLSGIIAVIIAVGAFAFTAPIKAVKKATTVTFHYTPSTFLKPQVESNANWTNGPGSGCSAGAKACQIEVLESYTHRDANNNPVLNDAGSGGSIMSIVASGSGSNYAPNLGSSTGIDSELNRN